MEKQREAFHNRMKFVNLDDVHKGTEKFPYDEYDLANYLLYLFDAVEND